MAPTPPRNGRKAAWAPLKNSVSIPVRMMVFFNPGKAASNSMNPEKWEPVFGKDHA
jgi:hypothetical protein